MESGGGSPHPRRPPFAKGCREHSGPEAFSENVPKNITVVFLGISKNNICFQNGLPGQTTLLEIFGPKFCVEPRSQTSDISRMSQIAI